jgi:hypothetical protein
MAAEVQETLNLERADEVQGALCDLGDEAEDIQRIQDEQTYRMVSMILEHDRGEGLPSEEELAQMDQHQANKIMGAMHYIQENIDRINAQAESEIARIEARRDSLIEPLEQQFAFLTKKFSPMFARVVDDNRGAKVKMLYGSLSRKRVTYSGSIPDDHMVDAIKLVRDMGRDDLVKPEEIIPERVAWGSLKGLLKIEEVEQGEGEDKKTFIQVVVKDTGEKVEFLEISKNGGDLVVEVQ